MNSVLALHMYFHAFWSYLEYATQLNYKFCVIETIVYL